MVAFVIFWAAVFALLFFLLGVIFKALASVFNYAIQASVASMIPIIGKFCVPILLAIALGILYAIVVGIMTEGFWSVIGLLILLIILIGITVALFGWLGALLWVCLELIAACFLYIIGFVSFGLEWLANKCECGYIKFLNVIVKRIDRY
ncbi:MAG: hypothetical protein HDR02_09225 [Lachnospiraceae bacterium]|nr:hypothetical protein [Lachnospiraceae bacterium]